MNTATQMTKVRKSEKPSRPIAPPTRLLGPLSWTSFHSRMVKVAAMPATTAVKMA